MSVADYTVFGEIVTGSKILVAAPNVGQRHAVVLIGR